MCIFNISINVNDKKKEVHFISPSNSEMRKDDAWYLKQFP